MQAAATDPQVAAVRMSSQIGVASKSTERKWKRRKTVDGEKPPPSRWRTQAEQQIYSSRLLDALRHVRRNSTSAPPRSRAVREAADRALAGAARGRTRWSRAILLSGRKTLKLKAARRQPRKPAALAKMGALMPAAVVKKSEAVQRKAKVLGRLVPGCGKLPLPALLEETSDYIAALEMQVRAMAALADMLSSVAVGDGGTPVTAPPGAPAS